MFSKVLSTAAVALAASSVVSAQTFTHCNPMEKDCPPDPAFGNQKINCDLTQGECKAFHSLEGTTIEYSEKGALFTIEKESNAPTVATNNYIFFGRLEVEVEPAPGKGVVTSLVLQSDLLDEIDWEWVGGDVDQVQSNYFSKGDTSTYDRGAYHPVPGAIGTAHTYTIEWNPEKIDWIVNGAIVRTLKASDAKGGKGFPQTPMQIKLGTWVAGRKDAPEGTVEWSGGYTDFSEGPFNAYYKSVKITDYAGGSSAASGSVKQYTYGDKTGDWESIIVEKGAGSIIGGDDKETDKETDTDDDVKETGTTSSAKASVTLIEPETLSKVYTKPKTTIEPETPVPTTMITPSSESTTSTPSETTGSETEETTTNTDGSSEATDPAEVPEDAAGSTRVTVGALAFAGVVALAQLF